MSTESSPLEGPSMLAILTGAFDAIRASPIILGLFLVSGILRFALPLLINSVVSGITGVVLALLIGIIVRILLIAVGVVIAYRALGGQIRTDSPFVLRLFMAFLAMVASYLLLIVGGLALLIPSVFRWIGLLVLIPVGIYVYFRLFLSTPLAMVEGYGPAEALSASWRLMNGSILATVFALVLVFIGILIVFSPVLWFIGSGPIWNVVGGLFVDTFLAGMQAFLYLQLAETH